MMKEHTTTPTAINGVDIDTLMGSVSAIKNEPELGACRFCARFRVKAKQEDLDRIRKLAKFSPVCNTIMKGANVAVEVELK